MIKIQAKKKKILNCAESNVHQKKKKKKKKTALRQTLY